METVQGFQRKIENRSYAVENSWKADDRRRVTAAAPDPDQAGDAVIEALKEIEQSLFDCSMTKQYDGYFPIQTGKLGRLGVFIKRVLRKLLMIFFGWYLRPIYQRQSYFNGKILNALALERSVVNELLAERARLQGKLEEQSERLSVSDRETKLELTKQTERLRETDAGLQHALESQAEHLSRTEEALKAQDDRVRESFRKTSEEVRRELDNRTEEMRRELSTRAEGLREENSETRRSLEEKLRQQQTENRAANEKTEIRLKKIENLPTDDEDFYHAFEEVFRGSRDDIKNRMEAYVPMLKERIPDWSRASFVDVGSGRGEWLDILHWNGAIDYVGVDLNERQNKIAESFGHKTVCEDCVQYLAGLPENSLDLITGFQIVEHLSMPDLMELLRQSYRTLKKGGMILFETPNPQNMIVASYTFYLDASHKRPLVPELMKFMVSWCGFEQTELICSNTHPHWEELRLQGENSPMARAVEEMSWRLYGPQDYALFAVK